MQVKISISIKFICIFSYYLPLVSLIHRFLCTEHKRVEEKNFLLYIDCNYHGFGGLQVGKRMPGNRVEKAKIY
jgi:hypothetical protein